MDGNVDRDHILLVEDVAPGLSFAIIAVEDLIADRMGQYASGMARDRLDQARLLYRLNPDVDAVYLDRRIREESFGDHGMPEHDPQVGQAERSIVRTSASVSRSSAAATMASTTSDPDGEGWTGPRLNHADYAARLAKRRAAAPVATPPRNPGTRRTASKRALLKAIEDAGGKW